MSDDARTTPLVVVDTNVWLQYFDLASPTADADRQLLRRAKKSGVVRLMMTAPRVLATDGDREELELRHRRKLDLREGEALMTVDRRRSFRDQYMLDEEHARTVARVVAQHRADHRPLERQQRADTLRELNATQRGWRDIMLQSEEQRRGLMVSWARDGMVALATKLGLPTEERALPDPRNLPSFYIPKVVHVTHLHGVLLTGRSPTATGLYDRAALQDAAAFADVLATTDGQLTTLAARTGLPLRVLNYQAWNNELRRLVG